MQPTDKAKLIAQRVWDEWYTTELEELEDEPEEEEMNRLAMVIQRALEEGDW